MKIKRESAIAFFIAVGYKTAEKWKNDRLEKTLNDFGDKLEDVRCDDLKKPERNVFAILKRAASTSKTIKISISCSYYHF